MHIGFGLLLPWEPYNYIRKMQLELHHRLSILPGRQHPHITFKLPFEVRDIEDYVEYFDTLAGKIDPFEVELSGIGSFGTEVLFLDVAPNQALTQLHFQILDSLDAQFGISPDPLEGHHIRFHATVCKPQTPDVFEEAKKLLEGFRPHFRFMSHKIGIYYHLGGDHSWIIYRQMPLKGPEKP